MAHTALQSESLVMKKYGVMLFECGECHVCFVQLLSARIAVTIVSPMGKLGGRKHPDPGERGRNDDISR